MNYARFDFFFLNLATAVAVEKSQIRLRNSSNSTNRRIDRLGLHSRQHLLIVFEGNGTEKEKIRERKERNWEMTKMKWVKCHCILQSGCFWTISSPDFFRFRRFLFFPVHLNAG